MELTIKRLNLEFISWEVDNGHGRNADDLRFGQYIHNKYTIEGVDTFYLENAEEAYYKLLENLTQNEERVQQD